MHKYELISKFEQRLTQLGCPADRARRSAREVADHFEDLKAAALEEGLLQKEVEARAASRLGDPGALAERLAAALRRSSWWGRHPVVSFCLLPSVGILLLMVFVPCLMLLVMRGSLPASRWRELADGGTGYGFFTFLVQTSFYGTLAMLMTIVCRLALRAVVGLRWMVGACLLCSLHALFINVWIDPHRLFVGYLTEPNWFCAAIPLLCAVVVAARQRRAARKFVAALLMVGLFAAPSIHAKEKAPLERGWIGGEYKVERPWSIRQFFFPPPDVVYDRSFPKSIQCSQTAAIKIMALGTNTPAALAGLQKGDLILQVDHSAVTSLNDFRRRIDECKPGNTVELSVFREGQTVELSAAVGREMVRSGSWLTICAPSVVHPWRLIPDTGLSVVFAGWETPRGLRYDLGAKKDVFDPSWRVWLGIFDISSGKTVIAETNVNPSPTMPRTAMAEPQKTY